jgi:beta-lactamase class A
MNRRGLIIGGGALALAGCRRASDDKTSVAAVAPAMPETIVDLSDLEREHGGRIGLSAQLHQRVSWRGRERFLHCSTFKLFVAACMLERVQRDIETVEREVAITAADIVPHSPVVAPAVGKSLSLLALMQAAVEVSDNAATNILIREMGGLAVLGAWYASAGDHTTHVDRLEPELNVADGDKDTSQPIQTTSNLDWIIKTYQPFGFLAEHRPLFDWLIATPTGPDRIRAGAPDGWTVAHKTGTSGTGQTNDIGYAYPASGGEPVRIAVYYDAPESLSAAGRDAVVAEATRRALAALGLTSAATPEKPAGTPAA